MSDPDGHYYLVRKGTSIRALDRGDTPMVFHVDEVAEACDFFNKALGTKPRPFAPVKVESWWREWYHPQQKIRKMVRKEAEAEAMRELHEQEPGVVA